MSSKRITVELNQSTLTHVLMMLYEERKKHERDLRDLKKQKNKKQDLIIQAEKMIDFYAKMELDIGKALFDGNYKCE